ncbi:MAG: GNAT family N-acetyltransferase [Kineosporiaceae bacterium]
MSDAEDPTPPDTAPQIEVRDAPEASRYELYRDGALAGRADYELAPGVIVFTHTVVDPAFEGQGLASALVRAALDDVRRRGRGAVVPQCSFVRGYLDRHPAEADVVER